MKKRVLSHEELNKRMQLIAQKEPVVLDKKEETSLAAAQAMDDGTAVSLSQYKKVKEYSGKMLLRIPKELHEELAEAAAANGVSLNQYALYKLSK